MGRLEVALPQVVYGCPDFLGTRRNKVLVNRFWVIYRHLQSWQKWKLDQSNLNLNSHGYGCNPPCESLPIGKVHKVFSSSDCRVSDAGILLILRSPWKSKMVHIWGAAVENSQALLYQYEKSPITPTCLHLLEELKIYISKPGHMWNPFLWRTKEFKDQPHRSCELFYLSICVCLT